MESKEKTVTLAERKNVSVCSSKVSITPSQKQLAIVDLLNIGEDTQRFASLFNSNPISKLGRRMQVLRMLGITMIPIAILLFLVGTIFCLRLNEWLKATSVRRTLRFSIEISDLVDNLQKERDFSAIYVSSIGLATKAYLVERYPRTDASIQSLTDWASQTSSRVQLDYFKSKEKFQNYLNRHRYELDSSKPSEKTELTFYSELIEIFMQWFYDAMTEASSGTVWKALVALQETMEAKEMLGIERAFGSIYYIHGGFQNRADYLVFAESQDIANATLKAAREFSSDVEGVYQETVTPEQQRLFEEVVQTTRYEIRNHPFPENMTGSLQRAKYWSDNMTMYVDAILSIQRVLTERIYNDLLMTEMRDQFILTILGVGMIFSVTVCPFVLRAVFSITVEIQSYSKTLLKRCKSLSMTKKETSRLQHHMVPPCIAEKLQKDGYVTAEHHPEVSIMYADIVDFEALASKTSPTQVVCMLDTLYSYFDKCLAKYNVYTMSVVNDRYMIVSGLPSANKNHAAEIADLALDLINNFHKINSKRLSKQFNLRIGCHTGGVSAGVIGEEFPRYIILGEPVLTANLINQTGAGGRIQISAAMRSALHEHKRFMMVPWDTTHPDDVLSCSTYWLVQGQGFSVSKKHSLCQSTSSKNEKSSDQCENE